MSINPLIPKSRIWNRTTPADGDLFESEFINTFQNAENFYNYILADIGSKKGLISGRLRNISASPTVLKAVQNNSYEVDGNLIRLAAELNLDFSGLTNIFRPDGTTPISATSETQNKFLYVLLTTTGSLEAMLIPDSEMEGSSHLYLNNPMLLKDYYNVTPGIFAPSKNGYYKNTKRIIAFLRLNGSNQIEFIYDLGNGHRFQDVEHLPVGEKLTQIRWKREHPSCYIPDGSTITNMNLEAPELFRILGTNILPDWTDRFARNISPNSTRSLRDTQEDAFQGFLISQLGIVYAPGFDIDNSSAYSIGQTVSYPESDGVNETPRIDNETRPKNYAELVQIVRG